METFENDIIKFIYSNRLYKDEDMNDLQKYLLEVNKGFPKDQMSLLMNKITKLLDDEDN